MMKVLLSTAPLLVVLASPLSFAHTNQVQLKELLGFNLGMGYLEAKAFGTKTFGINVDQFCSKNGPHDKDSEIYSCFFSTVYGMHQEEETMFAPKGTSFMLAGNDLQFFILKFYKGKLYQIDGSWKHLKNEAAAEDVIQSLIRKLGSPPSLEKISNEHEKSEIFNPLYRNRYQWNDNGTLLKVELEAVEFPLSSKALGKPDIGVVAEFSLVDLATDNFVGQTYDGSLAREKKTQPEITKTVQSVPLHPSFQPLGHKGVLRIFVKVIDPVALLAAFIIASLGFRFGMKSIFVTTVIVAVGSETLLVWFNYGGGWGRTLPYGLIAALIQAIVFYWIISVARRKKAKKLNAPA